MYFNPNQTILAKWEPFRTILAIFGQVWGNSLRDFQIVPKTLKSVIWINLSQNVYFDPNRMILGPEETFRTILVIFCQV